MNAKLPILLTGTVLHGNGLGNKMDMPTANILPDKDISGLDYGVYYSRIYANGRAYNGITNIGVRPTINAGNSVNVESFIIDFVGNLYGREISVLLLEFRRPEQKFSSLKELSATVHNDIEAGRKYEISEELKKQKFK